MTPIQKNNIPTENTLDDEFDSFITFEEDWLDNSETELPFKIPKDPFSSL